MSPVARRSTRPEPLVHDVAALERTALAWERTGFSLAAVGLLLVKVVPGGRVLQGSGLVLVGVAVLVVLVLVPWGYGRARVRVDPDEPAGAFAGADPWRSATLLTTALAVSGTAVGVAVDLWVTGVD